MSSPRSTQYRVRLSQVTFAEVLLYAGALRVVARPLGLFLLVAGALALGVWGAASGYLGTREIAAATAA